MTEVTILTPTPEDTLAGITGLGISLAEVDLEDAFTLRFRVGKGNSRQIARYCRRKNLKYTIRRTGSLRPEGLVRRPVLLTGIAIVLFLALFLPTRVLFIRVEGNKSVSTNQILEAAGREGICFGASRRGIRSEEVKNALLEAIPQLRWVGVNTRGCIATIRVEEAVKQKNPSPRTELCSIVAATDGIILSATATKGSLQCTPGQAVSRGQVLISPYRDCGICILAESAQGEILAQTLREITAVSPATVLRREAIADRQVNFSLILGKKRINLWKGSGISGGVCGRMYEEYYITLPGGWVLPIAIGKQTLIIYRVTEDSIAMSQDALSAYARQQMLAGTIAGSVTRESVGFHQSPGALFFTGDYLCTEMIGRVRYEQIGEQHGESN